MSTRTRRAPQATTGRRFARPGTATGRSSGAGRVPRTPMRFGRRPPQKSTGARVLEGLTGRLPGSGRRKTSRSAGGAKGKAGFAALAGVAAVAFRNRDRLTRLLSRNRSAEPTASPAVHPPTVAPGEERPAAA